MFKDFMFQYITDSSPPETARGITMPTSFLKDRQLTPASLIFIQRVNECGWYRLVSDESGYYGFIDIPVTPGRVLNLSKSLYYFGKEKLLFKDLHMAGFRLIDFKSGHYAVIPPIPGIGGPRFGKGPNGEFARYAREFSLNEIESLKSVSAFLVTPADSLLTNGDSAKLQYYQDKYNVSRHDVIRAGMAALEQLPKETRQVLFRRFFWVAPKNPFRR